MTLLSPLAALLAIVGAGVVYGTDVFGAIAQRPARARVDDAASTAAMGNLRRYADRRMSVPGVIDVLFCGCLTRRCPGGLRPGHSLGARRTGGVRPGEDAPQSAGAATDRPTGQPTPVPWRGQEPLGTP